MSESALQRLSHEGLPAWSLPGAQCVGSEGLVGSEAQNQSSTHVSLRAGPRGPRGAVTQGIPAYVSVYRPLCFLLHNLASIRELWLTTKGDRNTINCNESYTYI